MGIAEQEVQNRLQLFHELLNSTAQFFFWKYDKEMRLLETTSPSSALETVFEKTGGKKYILEHCANSRLPVILCSSIGLVWFAAIEQDEQDDGIRAIHVVGPVNDVEAVLGDREKLLKSLDMPVQWRIGLDRLARSLPMMPIITMEPYTVMLHRCVTGETIARRDIRFQKNEKSLHKAAKTEKKDRHRTYMLEQAVLSNIRNGNLQYQEDWARMSQSATGVRVEGQSMLLRGKMSLITFTGLCTRAAIDGGMTPEAAFTKGDAYLERAMACTTVGDLRETNHAMYDDFVRSVFACRTNPQYSPQIRTCCDYIEAHAEEEFTAEELARLVGYNEYYLSRKFKEETQVSIVNYTKMARVERAKQLLSYSSETVEEIGTRLHFCSRSYFSRVFREITGVTSAQYRKQMQKPE